MARPLNKLGAACGEVFSHPAYAALACTLAMVAFLLAVWLPNLGLIAQVFTQANAPTAAALGIALSLLGGIGTNFSPLAASYTIAIAVLFGLTVAMVAYLAKQRRIAAAGRGIAVGSGAMLSGVLGVGCAACGSLILGVVLPALGAAGALAALPLAGEEFGVLSVALLFAALMLASNNVATSSACALTRSENDAQQHTN